MRRLVVDDQALEPASADEREHRILDPDAGQVGRNDERVRPPCVRSVTARQGCQRMTGERERDACLPELLRGRHTHGHAAFSGGLDPEGTDGEGEVAHRVRTEVPVAELGPGGNGPQSGRRAHVEVEVGGRSRSALGQDACRRIRQPAAAGIPGEQGKERAETQSVPEARDPIIVGRRQPQAP